MMILIFIPVVAYVAVILFLRRGLYRLPLGGVNANGGVNDRVNDRVNDGINDDVNDAAAVAVNNKFSVIIAARNEAHNIADCLRSVFSQNIAVDRYEVIVVDDRSSDDTPRILRDAMGVYPNLRVVTIMETPPGVSPKKHAVTTAISTSVNEIIVFTDADCRVPNSWLASIDRYFADGADLVQGITTYSYPPGMDRMFWGLQSVDFLSHGVIAAAAIGADLPINSNANNMAFRREVFDRVGGYGEDVGVVLGDDDHLLQKVWAYSRGDKGISTNSINTNNGCINNNSINTDNISTNNNNISTDKIVFMTDKSGAVETAPTPTPAELLEQRRRWGSVTVHYGARQVALLSAVFVFYLTISATAVMSIFSHTLWLPIFLSLMLIKVTGESALMIPGTRIFNKKCLRKYIIPASILQLPMVLVAVVSGVFGKFEWKGLRTGRRVK